MTRLLLFLALALVVSTGCKKDSSNHSEKDKPHAHDGDEHAHDGDEHAHGDDSHSHDKTKPANPPTKEVPVTNTGAAANSGDTKGAATTDASVKGTPAAGGDTDKASDHGHEDDDAKDGHGHGHGEHSHD